MGTFLGRVGCVHIPELTKLQYCLYNTIHTALYSTINELAPYRARISDVVLGENSCPYCNDRMVLPGFNSFAAKHPNLLEEWDFVSNYLLADPDQISDTSAISLWWNCPHDSDHVYLMSPKQRLMFQKRHREPCPYCKGLRRKKRHFV